MAKPKSVMFQMQCSVCKEKNYNTSKNPTENKDKLELSKYCSRCRQHTLHKETKISKAKK